MVNYYDAVGALAIYYKCVQILSFASSDVAVDAAAGQLSRSIAILLVTKECPIDLTWSVAETTTGIPTLTSLNSNAKPLSLDSATYPTSVDLVTFPTSLVIGTQYTF